MPVTLVEIRNRFKERKPKRRGSYESEKAFHDALYPAYEIAVESYSLKFDGREKFGEKQSARIYKNIVVHNFLVNCVSALEVYFKNIVLEENLWSDTGLKELLAKEKLTLGDAYEMFSKEKLTREYIVSHYFSFQNIESIASIFTKLVGVDFFDAIESERVVWGRKRETLLGEYPNWRSDLAKLYEIRNRYVHDGVFERVNNDDLANTFGFVLSFHGYVSEYFHRRYIRVLKAM